MPQLFYPQGRIPSTHGIGLVGPKADMVNGKEKKTLHCIAGNQTPYANPQPSHYTDRTHAWPATAVISAFTG